MNGNGNAFAIKMVAAVIAAIIAFSSTMAIREMNEQAKQIRDNRAAIGELYVSQAREEAQLESIQKQLDKIEAKIDVLSIPVYPQGDLFSPNTDD